MRYELEKKVDNILVCEEYFRDTGIFRVRLAADTEIVGISANSWNQFRDSVYEISMEDKIVISPELITYAGLDFADLHKNRRLIEERLDEIMAVSLLRPETVFVIGTPLFVINGRPRNSAVFIENGEISGFTNKRAGATDEEAWFFDMVADEAPAMIPNTNIGLVICSDLVVASLYTSQDHPFFNRMLELSSKENLIGQDVSVVLPQAKSVVAMCCWSVGGKAVKETGVDDYYRIQLRNICWRLMRNTSIREVAIVDRIPTNLDLSTSKLTPNKPFNGVIRFHR